MKNKYVAIPIIVNITILVCLLAVVIVTRTQYHKMLLRADSYYTIAEEFAQGGSLLHKFRGPVLPLIFSILFFFPQNMHPFLRLLFSIVISVGTILILFAIVRKYISGREFLFGSILFVVNPVYIHWTFRPFPEIYLAFFLGLFMFSMVRYYGTEDISYAVYAAIVFVISFFIKPVFIFIPIATLLAAIVIKSKRIAVVSLILLVLGIMAYKAQDEFTKVEYTSDVQGIERTYEYVHKTLLISESFWVDYVLKTGQFHDPSINEYNLEYKKGKSLGEYTLGWISNFYERYPGGGFVLMNLYFIYKEPLLFLQKLLVSPFFYFSMSARTNETLVKLAFSIFSIVLSIIGIITVSRHSKHKKEIVLIISIIIGYASLHLVTHSMNRYSLPILPYLYVWGGIPIVRIIDKFLTSLKRRSPKAQSVNNDDLRSIDMTR